jgi:hypothetical protein
MMKIVVCPPQVVLQANLFAVDHDHKVATVASNRINRFILFFYIIKVFIFEVTIKYGHPAELLNTKL